MSSYWAYLIDPGIRNALLRKFHPKFADVIAHHITISLGETKPVGWPDTALIQVTGYASDQSLETLVCTVNGKTLQPRGKRLHITWSLDATTRKPKESADVIADGTAIQPVSAGMCFMAKLTLLGRSTTD